MRKSTRPGRRASAILRLTTSSNLAGREPQDLRGVPPLAQGGNVFAVSVAESLAEAEQRQASGRRAPNRSFVEYRALQNRRSGGCRASLRKRTNGRRFDLSALCHDRTHALRSPLTTSGKKLHFQPEEVNASIPASAHSTSWSSAAPATPSAPST